MKKFLNILGVTITSVCLISCSFSNEKEKNKTFSAGKWNIIRYLQNGKEMKDLYNEVDFTFTEDDQIVAEGNNYNCTGKWYVIKDDTTDDAPVTDIDFNMLFECKNVLSGLNGEWKIVKKTNSSLSLIRTNKSGKGYLQFVKE